MLNLPAINRRLRLASPQSYNFTSSTIDPSLRQHVQQAIHYAYLCSGQPPLPALEAFSGQALNAEIKHCLEEMQRLLPCIFDPACDVQLQVPLHCPLPHLSECLELHVNVQQSNKQLALYEWGIRKAELTSDDQIKAWAAVQHFGVDPGRLKITIVALSTFSPATCKTFQWSSQQQRETEDWLLNLMNTPLEELIRQGIFNDEPQTPNQQTLDLSEIEEIPIRTVCELESC